LGIRSERRLYWLSTSDHAASTSLSAVGILRIPQPDKINDKQSTMPIPTGNVECFMRATLAEKGRLGLGSPANSSRVSHHIGSYHHLSTLGALGVRRPRFVICQPRKTAFHISDFHFSAKDICTTKSVRQVLALCIDTLWSAIYVFSETYLVALWPRASWVAYTQRLLGPQTELITALRSFAVSSSPPEPEIDVSYGQITLKKAVC